MNLIINQGFSKKTYNVPGIGMVELTQLQEIPEDTVLGKALLQHFPSICSKPKVAQETKEVKEPIEPEKPTTFEPNLNEPPIQDAEVILPKVEEPTKESDEGIQPLKSFSTKDELEEYGLTFEIQLDKRKTIKKMYEELVQELDKRK